MFPSHACSPARYFPCSRWFLWPDLCRAISCACLPKPHSLSRSDLQLRALIQSAFAWRLSSSAAPSVPPSRRMARRPGISCRLLPNGSSATRAAKLRGAQRNLGQWGGRFSPQPTCFVCLISSSTHELNPPRNSLFSLERAGGQVHPPIKRLATACVDGPL